jgi:D-alanyl-D-alanine carboxypeptidase
MENNPYKADYHKYLENLKSNLDNSNSYTPSNQSLGQDLNYANEITKTSFLKYGLAGVLIIVVGISVVSFFTQGVLLVFDKKNDNNVKNQGNIDNGNGQNLTEQEKVDKALKNIYVRADLGRDIFDVSTATEVSTSTTELSAVSKEEKIGDIDITKYFNVNIPGVSRIGYDESLGNSFLTDNINKYSDRTLVIGERGSPDGMFIGGGDSADDLLIDKYDIISKAVVPVLSSRAFILADLNTGEIILDKKSDDIHPIASVSKLMTAVIATEKMNLQEVAIVSRDATNAYGGQGGLSLGEKIRLSDLIFPLLMESSNDAAEVFADHYGHQNFLDEMNKKAAMLGMEDTYYNDPSGLDPKNSSTPKDLLKLVRYIWKNDPTIFDTTRVKQFSIKGHTWLNRNAQLPLTGYIGGKNGFIDQALQTTASIFEIPTVKGGVRKVVIVVLKSNDKNGDVIKLINFMKKSVVYTP